MKNKMQINLFRETTNEEMSTFKAISSKNHVRIARLSRLISIGASESLLVVSFSLTASDTTRTRNITDLFHFILIKC